MHLFLMSILCHLRSNVRLVFGKILILYYLTAICECSGKGVICIDELTSRVDWLMAWPAGLKLNGELSAFFGSFYSSLLYLVFPPKKSSFVRTYLIMDSPILGPILFGSCADFYSALSAICIHIILMQKVSNRIYRFELAVIRSLFLLFRGKHYNVLRNGRIDNALFEPDQMLMGTIMLSLVAFTFPTCITYYFAMVWQHFLVFILPFSFAMLLYDNLNAFTWPIFILNSTKKYL